MLASRTLKKKHRFDGKCRWAARVVKIVYDKETNTAAVSIVRTQRYMHIKITTNNHYI